MFAATSAYVFRSVFLARQILNGDQIFAAQLLVIGNHKSRHADSQIELC